MKVTKRHYTESMEYLSRIANKDFYKKLNKELEDIMTPYKLLEKQKLKLYSQYKNNKTEDLKESLNSINCRLDSVKIEIKNEMQHVLHIYKEDYFRNHINRVIAYKRKMDIEDVVSLFIIESNSPENEDYKIIYDANKNINNIFVNATVLALIYGCTRQNINAMLIQNKLHSPVIGHVTAFKLLDIIK